MKMTLALLTALLLAPLVALCAAEPITIDLTKRTWQGIPGLERTAKGRVFASWFNAPASRLKKSCRGAKSKCLSFG